MDKRYPGDRFQIHDASNKKPNQCGFNVITMILNQRWFDVRSTLNALCVSYLEFLTCLLYQFLRCEFFELYLKCVR